METSTGAKPKNLLTADVSIKGELSFSGDLYFDGKLEGGVKSEGNLILGENAQITGDLSTGNVMVQGKVMGNVTAAQKIILKSKSEVHGDLTSAFLIMEDGVTFVGKLDVNPSRAPAGADKGAMGSGSPSASSLSSDRPVQPARPVDSSPEPSPGAPRRPPQPYGSSDNRGAAGGGPKIPTAPRRDL
jgi:cytoskeletal protein CcmA (bactofilin family)